ncbi:MAG TPA: hypothetical protein VF546_22635 [Pyrinomonadaceae bacterium]|jgi:flavin reductase (DIM6/NTAB) family NADH-FMN oxidoreductase RutF
MPKEGDTYNVGQGVGVGRNVRMTHTTVNQAQGAPPELDLAALAGELAQLRAELKRQATEPEHDVAVGAVAAAEAEAKKGDGSKALEYLSTAGKWALDIAVKIGTPVAIEALKHSLGG